MVLVDMSLTSCLRVFTYRHCCHAITQFLPARRYASAGLCDSDVSVRPSVCPSVRLSHAGIVRSRAKAGS